MKKTLTATSLLSLFLFATTCYGQKKMIEKLLSNQKDTTRSSSFLILPALGYAQETGFEFGVGSIYSFYADKSDTTTRNSTLLGGVSVTTKGQFNFKIQPDIWTKGNKYHYMGELRYRNFPFNFYGIGDETNEADKDVLVQKLFRLEGSVEKRFAKHYYGGLNLSYENYRYRDKEAGGIYDAPDPAFTGRSGGNVIFAGISQILDTRNTNTYTTKGFYLKLNYSYAPDFWGGENYSGSKIEADLRNFNTIARNLVLGLNANFQALPGKNPPFYLLPQLGNDQIMRGYYGGRYRDENLLAAQTELRYKLSQRIGIVGFAGLGTVYADKSLDFDNLKPSYGGGLRYFFDLARNLSVRFDYGVGEKRENEKRQTGFYFSFGEAF
ncbi:BamA/TamA family outer membrane protein [Pedobacter sp. HMF7647]|uniref:BamA/TamA family outer membrane protein n=1 Tax=Hufsiella arboris TaxID=2695275 RepID=A0A7K1Y497_9SPHI|nr:BamA/TamA family outer membrane protein [Hufsiella arboris]MXV49407.1 BamA/TamA family outer membrane protein [Hufsiella arboris]